MDDTINFLLQVVSFQVVVVTDLKQSWVVYNYDIGNLTWNEQSDNRTILVGHSAPGEFQTVAVNPVQAGKKSAYRIDKIEGNKGTSVILLQLQTLYSMFSSNT